MSQKATHYEQRESTMVVMSKRRTECLCVKCGHSWMSNVKNPQQCPGCKRKDWDGLHNSMGRLLVAVVAGECKCSRCDYTWTPRKSDPAQCPKCKRYDWRTAAAGGGEVVAAKPVMRAGRYILRVCNWCKGTFEDDIKGRRAGMCTICGTDWHTGEDTNPPERARWSREKYVLMMSRADERGRIVAVHTACRPVDPFDPDGLLREREGLL